MPSTPNVPEVSRDISLDPYSPFPPADPAAQTPTELLRAFESRLASGGLPPIDAARLATDTETRFAAAKNDLERKRVNYSMCLAMTGQANRAMRAAGEKRSWHGMVRAGTREAVETRWVLLDDSQLRAIEARGGYVRFTRVLQRGLLSLPFALVFWAAAYNAYQNGTQTHIAIAAVAWIVWFGARSYIRRKNAARPK